MSSLSGSPSQIKSKTRQALLFTANLAQARLRRTVKQVPNPQINHWTLEDMELGSAGVNVPTMQPTANSQKRHCACWHLLVDYASPDSFVSSRPYPQVPRQAMDTSWCQHGFSGCCAGAGMRHGSGLGATKTCCPQVAERPLLPDKRHMPFDSALRCMAAGPSMRWQDTETSDEVVEA